MTLRQLKKASYTNLLRLARYLKLQLIDDMSHKQLVKLIKWRLTRPDMKIVEGFSPGGWKSG